MAGASPTTTDDELATRLRRIETRAAEVERELVDLRRFVQAADVELTVEQYERLANALGRVGARGGQVLSDDLARTFPGPDDVS